MGRGEVIHYITDAGWSTCIKDLLRWFQFALVDSVGTAPANKQLSPFPSNEVLPWRQGLSSGRSDMGSPFMLQQKTCQAAFQDLSAPSMQGEINSYLGRFILPSLFKPLLLLSSLFFSNCLFLPLPLFLPCVLPCLSICLAQTSLQVSSGSLLLHISSSSKSKTLEDFCLGFEKALAFV